MKRNPQTIAAGRHTRNSVVSGAVTPPLHASDTYEWASPDDKPPFDYSRTVNPNRTMLVEALSELENAVGGAVTSSGQSAALLALLLLKPGARIVAPHDCYGGTYRLLNAWADQAGARVSFIDQRDDAAVAHALAYGAELMWVETPSNPLMRLVDIQRRATQAHEAGALVLADNTLATPCRQTPLDLGCDLVLHSTTKAINGHSDLFGGALLTSRTDLVERIEWWCNAAGLAGSAYDSWQTLRGLRTLPLRIAAQETSAFRLANFLEQQPLVAKVNYPGLESHPDHQLGLHQASGPGFMLSFELKGGYDEARRFVQSLGLITLASSLGGFGSLICLPATMTHRGMPPEAQREAGISPGLLRLSVGLECIDDLLIDLERGFTHAK